MGYMIKTKKYSLKMRAQKELWKDYEETTQKEREREREKKRKRERERERERDKDKERVKERQGIKAKDTEPGRETNRQADSQNSTDK